MKLALWRIILNHVHRSRSSSYTRVQALTAYRMRLLQWLDAGGDDPVPEPEVPASFKFQWALFRKITREIANHAEEAR